MNEHGRDVVVAADPTDHMMVAAAMARLGSSGCWDSMLAGGVVSGRMDRADVELLVSAGILAADGAGFRLLRDDPWLQNGVALANGILAGLQRALHHAEGRSAGWDGQDPDLVLRQGRGSARIGEVLAGWLPEMPSVQRAFRDDGRFLDVGVGVAAISINLCQRFPELRCVGLDVVPEVLDLGRQEVAAAGLAERIELRLQSVSDLADEAAYDLGWLPQPFIPRPAFEAGVSTMLAAVRPGGWLVAPLMTPPEASSSFERAVVVHAAHVLGGGPITVAEGTALFQDAGWVNVTPVDVGSQVCLRAQRPT